jgi:hypothetical protein
MSTENGVLAPLSFGDVRLCLKDSAPLYSKYDRLAYGNRSQVLLIGLVDYGNKIRAIRALLNSAAGKLMLECSGGRTSKKSDSYYYPRNPGRLMAGSDGYRMYINKLEYGLIHALFVSKEPGFMTIVNPDSLWEELNDTRFTTPVLREWMPYLEERLRKKSLLEDAWCFRCECGFITAMSPHLDQIVSEGLQTGKIIIPEPPAPPIDTTPQLESSLSG